MKPTHYLYHRWKFMNNSVNNPNHGEYHKVGGRGIKMDPAFARFENYAAMVETNLGPPPTEHALLARIDQEGDWTIDNMEWTTHKALSRRLPTYPIITYAGRTATIKEWSEITGINDHTIRDRHRRGWTIERTLTTPAQRTKKNLLMV